MSRPITLHAEQSSHVLVCILHYGEAKLDTRSLVFSSFVVFVEKDGSAG